MHRPAAAARAIAHRTVAALSIASASASAAPQPGALVLDNAFDIQSISPDGVIELAINADALATLREAPSVVIEDFPATATERHTFNLRPFRVFTSDCRGVLAAGAMESAAPLPDVTLLRGSVDNDPASIVFLSIAHGAVNGFFEADGIRYLVATGRDPGASPVVYAPEALTSAKALPPLPSCGAESLPEYQIALNSLIREHTERGGSTETLPRRVVNVAVEADFEFYSLYNDEDACASYIATLFGAVSTIYRRELNVDLRISHSRIWITASDPWTETVAQNQLAQLRLNYLTQGQNIPRNTVHLLSARAFAGAGGTAYLNGLCSDLGYGISGYLNGFFPVPLVDNQPQNWDAYVVTHEIGHNFGAPHTHQMVPPIDGCGLGDCSNAPAGTIMSYCHTCAGALTNIAFNFHPRILNERMIPFLSNVSCNLNAPAACLADLDENGRVEGADLGVLLESFFQSTPVPYTQGDLNGDAFISGADLSVFLRVFGQYCN